MIIWWNLDWSYMYRFYKVERPCRKNDPLRLCLVVCRMQARMFKSSCEFIARTMSELCPINLSLAPSLFYCALSSWSWRCFRTLVCIRIRIVKSCYYPMILDKLEVILQWRQKPLLNDTGIYPIKHLETNEIVYQMSQVVMLWFSCSKALSSDSTETRRWERPSGLCSKLASANM